ncbi:MAG: extracellular solute-binding protein [Anaerolineaceae bacterium]|nr:extracellular solute-binding protein [Anaerolineaceae bacterium]
MKNKSLTFVTILLLFVMVVSACAPKSIQQPQEEPAQPAEAEESAEEVESITLEYWVFSDYAQGDAGDLQKTFIAEFEAEHPGVTINISGKGDDELNTGLVTSATSNTLPDLFMNSTSNGAKFVKVNAVDNVYDRWMEMSEDFRSQFNPTMIAEVSQSEGTMYGMPYTGYATFLYRNLTVLGEAGIDPDVEIADWDAWLAQMEQISDAGFVALPSFSYDWWDFVSIYSGAGTADEWGIDFDNNVTKINPEKFAQAAQFLVDAKPFGTELGIGDQGATDLFITNQLAYTVSGPWANPTFLEAKETNGLDYDYVVIPGATADNKGGIRGTEYIGFAPNGHIDLAWEFAMYICDEPQMTRWTELLARYNSNEVSLSKVSDPLLEITTEGAKSALFERPPHFVEAYPGDYLQILTDNLAAIELGDVTSDEGAANLIEELNAVIAAE